MLRFAKDGGDFLGVGNLGSGDLDCLSLSLDDGLELESEDTGKLSSDVGDSVCEGDGNVERKFEAGEFVREREAGVVIRNCDVGDIVLGLDDTGGFNELMYIFCFPGLPGLGATFGFGFVLVCTEVESTAFTLVFPALKFTVPSEKLLCFVVSFGGEAASS